MASKSVGLASTGNVDWSVFLQEGVIITLTIKYYRGTTTVDFSELGINDADDEALQSFLGEYITPGTKCLIPPDIKGQLKSIETSARQNLKEHSFDCSALSSTGKFVPKSMYREFKEINEELRDRFYTIRDQFADNYERIIEHVRRDYRVLASKLYMQSHPAAKRPSSKWVNAFIDKIIEQIASPDEIIASFEFKTTPTMIPEYLLKVISQKQNIDEKVMRIAASNQVDVSSKQTASAKKSKKADADAKSVEIDEEAAEISRDIAEAIDKQSKEQADDFVTDILMRVRTEAADGADNVIRAIDRNNGKMVGRTSVKAHSLVDDMRKMNFYGDTELEERVDALDEALGEDAKSRDVAAVRAAAEELLNWSQDSMREIHDKTVERKVAAAPKRKTTKAKTTTKKATPKKKTPAKAKITVPKNTKRRTIKQRS